MSLWITQDINHRKVLRLCSVDWELFDGGGCFDERWLVRGSVHVKLSDFGHIYDLKMKEPRPSICKRWGRGEGLAQPSGRKKVFKSPEEIPDSIRGNPLGNPQICTLFTRYALLNHPEKPVPTRNTEGMKTCRGEYLVELHRCSPHILWLH